MDRGGFSKVLVGELIDEEVVLPKAGVALATIRVEDPERGPPPRRAVPVPRDQRLRALAHDVAPEADPRAPGKLQAETGRFGDGAGQAAGETGRFQHHEQRLRSSGQRRQPTQPIGDDRRLVRGGEATAGQVEDEQVHRASGKQRPTDGQPFIERLRSDDHQPLQADASGDRLNRIEAPGQIEPGYDGSRGLGLGSEPEDEGCPTARAVAANGDARRARQATRSQDRVERREPCPDDPTIRRPRFLPDGWFGRWDQGWHGREGEGAFGDPRSCRSPASLQACHGCRHVRGEGRHRSKIEHLFYRIKS
jgi:hypothetical protein